MSRVAFCLVALFFVGSQASAQIIYEPVQYQYHVAGTTYYYGGSNPAVHTYAAEPYSTSGTWGRVNGWAFASGGIDVHREVANEPPRVFTDGYGWGFLNAHTVGFTASDARNEAYNNMPRYFVKRDVLRAAVRDVDGTWVVPAQAQPIRVYKSNGAMIHEYPAASEPRPLMVIPKDMLKPSKPSDRQLTLAQ